MELRAGRPGSGNCVFRPDVFGIVPLLFLGIVKGEELVLPDSQKGVCGGRLGGAERCYSLVRLLIYLPECKLSIRSRPRRLSRFRSRSRLRSGGESW